MPADRSSAGFEENPRFRRYYEVIGRGWHICCRRSRYAEKTHPSELDGWATVSSV